MIHRGLLTLVVVAPLVAFGGAYRWFTLPLLSLTAALCLVNIRALVTAGRTRGALDSALVAACAVIASQLVPLPDWMVQVLSPESARIRAALRLDVPLAMDAWKPLTIDPQATLHALGVSASATLAFFAARGVFSEGGLRRWCRALAWTGLVVALAAVVQRAVSPNLIWGFWQPHDPTGRPFGPFVNRNHFAAWLLMAGFVVGGHAFAHARVHIGSRPRHVRRLLRVVATAGSQVYVSAGLFMALTVVITLSRSGMVGLVAGLLLAGFVARRRIQVGPTAQLSFATIAIVLGLALASAFVDSTRVAARFNETMQPEPGSRVVIWRESLPLLRDFWATGAGAGAYGSAMLLYEGSAAPVHFNQAHSHYLQLAAEGGMLLVVPWLVAALLFLREAGRALAEDRGETFFIRLGALCGIGAIAVQSIWETPLRMGANAVLFGLLCGVALHRRDRF